MVRYKDLGHNYEKYFKTFTSKVIRINEEDIKGYAALVEIQEVHQPLIVGEKGSEICFYDNGYSELAFLPDNENWMVWALYNEKGKIFEWYFDITRENSVDENGTPYCNDMYLDAALMSDGKIMIFDEDELLDARNNGDITQDEFDMAYRVLNKLLENIINVEYLEKFCERLRSCF
jgi:predicted RNA-binding protein associated with RNAse of E/G family